MPALPAYHDVRIVRLGGVGDRAPRGRTGAQFGLGLESGRLGDALSSPEQLSRSPVRLALVAPDRGDHVARRRDAGQGAGLERGVLALDVDDHCAGAGEAAPGRADPGL